MKMNIFCTSRMVLEKATHGAGILLRSNVENLYFLLFNLRFSFIESSRHTFKKVSKCLAAFCELSSDWIERDSRSCKIRPINMRQRVLNFLCQVISNKRDKNDVKIPVGFYEFEIKLASYKFFRNQYLPYLVWLKCQWNYDAGLG